MLPICFVDPQAAGAIEDEVKVAEQKFQESKVLAENAMSAFLASDVSFIVLLPSLYTVSSFFY